jgi:ribosome maturation factor RimP
MEGLELVHIEYHPRGEASMLTIYIDKPGGVNLDDCARISRHVSVLLDVEDLIPHHYLLEVTSLGIERPLFTECDYQRFTGEQVRLVTREKIEKRRNFAGLIHDFSEGVLSLECGGETYQIPFTQIKKANLVHRFD